MYNSCLIHKKTEAQEGKKLDFSSSLVVNTLHFHGRGKGSVPGWGMKILHALWYGRKNPEN